MSRTKSPSDITAIKQSVVATEAAMEVVIVYLQQAETPTSKIAKDIIDAVLDTHHCESPEGRIVAAGIKSYEPHYVGEGVVEQSQPIVIDIYPQSK